LSRLEQARAAKIIGGGLEAKVHLHAGPEAPGLQKLLEEKQAVLPALFIVSQVVIHPSAIAASVPAEHIARSDDQNRARRRREMRALLELFQARRRKLPLPDRLRALHRNPRRNRIDTSRSRFMIAARPGSSSSFVPLPLLLP